MSHLSSQNNDLQVPKFSSLTKSELWWSKSLQLVIVYASCINILLRHSLPHCLASIESAVHVHLMFFKLWLKVLLGWYSYIFSIHDVIVLVISKENFLFATCLKYLLLNITFWLIKPPSNQPAILMTISIKTVFVFDSCRSTVLLAHAWRFLE